MIAYYVPVLKGHEKYLQARFHQALEIGVLIKSKQGFFALQNVDELVGKERVSKGKPVDTAITSDEQKKALRKYIRQKTRFCMHVAKGSQIAINSMGIGSVLSFLIGFMPMFVGTHVYRYKMQRVGGVYQRKKHSVVSESTERIVSILLNTPTEVHFE